MRQEPRIASNGASGMFLFARQADIEGYPGVAGLFRDTAVEETGHANSHL